MAAFTSVWMGMATLGVAMVMLLWRSAFTDLNVWLVLWLGAPGTMCVAGLVLWAYRKRDIDDPGVEPQRLQCKVAIALALAATIIVYALVMGARQVPVGVAE